jgi:small subunit ribosomal protein S6
VRYYEAIYIVHPNIEQDGLTKLIEATKEMLKKRGGEILYEEVMGKKRLAYSIQKQRFGTYVLLQFRGDGAGNVRLNQDLELNDDILAHMIVRIDEDEVREAREEETELSEHEVSTDVEQKTETVEDDEPEKVEPEVEEEKTVEDDAAEEEVTVEEVASAEEEDLEPEEEK